jgi:hypothetical protein
MTPEVEEQKHSNRGRGMAWALDAGLSPRRHGLIPDQPMQAGVVVDKQALGDAILRVLLFFRHYDSTNAPY